MKFTKIYSAGLLLAALASSANVHAGPYSDDLAKCLVRSTTGDDKRNLVQWIFSIASVHPALTSLMSITDDRRTTLNKDVARLFEALLTERCSNETRDAMKYEGPETLKSSFGLLGQVAMRELFADPGVAKELGRFTEYIDTKKFEALKASIQ